MNLHGFYFKKYTKKGELMQNSSKHSKKLIHSNDIALIDAIRMICKINDIY